MSKKSILVADDLSERSTQGRLRSKLLRDSAVELAKKLKMEVDLLYVKNTNSLLLSSQQIQSLEESFDDIAKAAFSHFKKSSVKGRIHLRAGIPTAEILKFTTISSKTQILLMGTHGKKGLKKMILGSVAEEVLRHTKVPVMILGPAAQSKQTSLKLKSGCKGLLLTELSPNSEAAEKFAEDFSQQLGCEITAFHCVGDQIMKARAAIYGSAYAPIDMDNVFTDLTNEASKVINKKSLKWKSRGLNIQPLLDKKEQSIEKSFLSQVRKDYDFVILGTHGRGNFLSAFLGSTARTVIQTSPVPVFVIRGRK